MSSRRSDEPSDRFEALFEQLNDPVVEFRLEDGEPIIVNANEAFYDVFCMVDSVRGLPLNELIVPEAQRAEAKHFDQRTAEGRPNREVIERMTPNGTRKFLYRGVPVSDDRGFAIYSDITDKLRQERQLDVLQRVIRHNLRNDVNVITGNAERALEAAEDEEVREALKTVKQTAEGLSQLCEEAQTIRHVIDESPSLEPTTLKPVIDTVTDECLQRFQQAVITVDCPPELTVRADSRLETLLDCLVDNAIRHNTASLPKVTIEAREADEMIELTMTDNGPGIPTIEQELITSSERSSPLSHGSGLGLWLVKYLTESYGGQITIDTPDHGGTVVTIRFVQTPDEQQHPQNLSAQLR